MSHAQRKLPALDGHHDAGHHLLPVQEEADLPGEILHATGAVGGHRLAEGLEALPGVVEVRDGLVELRRREVEQHLLELAEGCARLTEVLRALGTVVGHGVADEIVHTPVALLFVAVHVAAVGGFDQVQRAARGILPRLRKLAAQVLRHPLHVGHDLLWLLEHVGVDLLEHVLLRATAQAVAVVDESCGELGEALHLARKAEVTGDLHDFVSIHGLPPFLRRSPRRTALRRRAACRPAARPGRCSAPAGPSRCGWRWRCRPWRCRPAWSG